MKSKRAFFLALVALCLAVAAGCTDSDPTDTGIYRVEFLLDSTGGAGFDCALMNFAKLTVRPLDGTCSGGTSAGLACGQVVDCPGGTCEGNLAQQLVPGGIGVASNLQQTSVTGSLCEIAGFSNGGTELPSVLLSRGTYLIDEFETGEAVLGIDGGEIQRCSGVADVTGSYPDSALRFEVGPSKSAVSLSIDLDALDGVVAAPPNVPDCGAFIAAAPSIITIN